VAKVGTSNQVRTINLKRLQCVVENSNNNRPGGFNLSQDEDMWWTVVNMVMNLLVQYKAKNFLTGRELSTSLKKGCAAWNFCIH
jgi:hypothetical protein